jgi:ribosomal-protein-alanine N-acetyltransferase
VFTTRDYAPEDFDELLALDQLCFTQGIAYSERELRYFLNRKGGVRLVAAREGTEKGIAGFIVAAVEKGQNAHVFTIDVHPDYQRSGLGTQLMREAEQRFAEAKCRSILLEVAVDNLAAISFYKRHGFSVLKSLPRYYNNSIDGLLLGKKM